MKSYTAVCFFLSLAMILFPLTSVERATDVFSQEISGTKTTEITETTTEAEEKPATVKVMSAGSDSIMEMPLKEYLTGVVAAEINPAYHEEAVKAQVIAAHTKLEYTKLHKTDAVGNADITDSSLTHQGFLSKSEQQEKWGENYKAYIQKIEKCVDEVIDIIITYNNEPINAVFHAISNGNTENATDVWGGEYPYLQSVTSVGDRLSPAYSSEVTISKSEFKKQIEKAGATLDDEPSDWVQKITNTDTGMVKTITIGDKAFKGAEIREIFNLKSSTFTIKNGEDDFLFTVSGYGHGAGMSQYGANYMAQQGFSCEEILRHYYTGVEIKELP